MGCCGKGSSPLNRQGKVKKNYSFLKKRPLIENKTFIEQEKITRKNTADHISAARQRIRNNPKIKLTKKLS